MGLQPQGLNPSLRNLTTDTDAIPSSVAYQWTAANFADPWPADKGNADISINGLSTATMSNGDTGVQGDGTDDSAIAPIKSIGNQINQSAWEFDLQYSSAGFEGVGQNRPFIDWRFDKDEGFNNDPGNIHILIEDSAQNRLAFAPSSNPNLDDGNVHKVSILLNDITTSDAELIIDGTNHSLNFGSSANPSISSDLAKGPAFWARNANSIDRYVAGFHSIIRIHDQAINSQTI